MLTISDHVLRHHMLVRGASGGGKSQFLKQVLWSNILRGYYCCVIDPVGSLVPPTLDFLGAMMLKLSLRENTPYAGWNEAKRQARLDWAKKFVVLDFTDPDIRGFRYNPIQPQDGLTVDETVGDFLRCLERVIGDLVEMRRLQMVLRSVLTLVAQLGGTTLRDALDFLCMDTADIHAYLRRLEEKRSAGQLARPVRPDLVQLYMSRFFANTSGRERRELVQSAWNAVGIFLSDAVAARFVSSPESNISFDEIVNGGRWLLVHLPLGLDLNTQKVLGAMILKPIQLVAERRSSADVESGRVPPFSLMVDEFQTMMGRHWAEAIARVRNKGLNLVVAHQNSTQPPFETPEGQALLRAIEANASTHVYFRLHIDDAERAAVPVFRPRGHQLKREEMQVSETRSSSWSETESKSVTRSTSESIGESDGVSATNSIGETRSTGFSTGSSTNRGMTDTHSFTQGWNSGVSWSDADSFGARRFSYSGGNSQAFGLSFAHGFSTVNTCMDSTARTVASAEGVSRTRSQTKSEGVSRASSESESHGFSSARGETRIREYYSVSEEARIRAYELAELPRRHAWVWVNDAESASYLIVTHDIPQSFTTKLGGRDFKSEFLSLAQAPVAPSEPVESLPERALMGGRNQR